MEAAFQSGYAMLHPTSGTERIQCLQIIANAYKACLVYNYPSGCQQVQNLNFNVCSTREVLNGYFVYAGAVVGGGGGVGWTTGTLMCRGRRMTSCVFLCLPPLLLIPVLSVDLQLTILAMLVGH